MAEELRQKLYNECGRSTACRKAADYYIALLQNPCYPPQGKMTYKMRKFYMEFVKRYGYPPRCNIRALVEERLRGTVLEQYINEIAELAERLRHELNITSRVAAATATVVVAETHGVRTKRGSIAARFGTVLPSVMMHMRKAVDIYIKAKKAT
jgi:hypothetical protein